MCCGLACSLRNASGELGDLSRNSLIRGDLNVGTESIPEFSKLLTKEYISALQILSSYLANDEERYRSPVPVR